MSGDWIKMRTSLLTNPKINGIARELESCKDVGEALSTGYGGVMSEIVTRNVMRHVTVSSLLVVWGAANEHTKDGVFKNADLSDIDDMTGIPGFGLAMESVGWALYDDEMQSVTLPNFNEYNTSGHERCATAKTNAQRQKEYRERQSSVESNVTNNVTRDVTSNHREEKRREEKIDTANTSPDKLPTCPTQTIVDLYHEALPELPAVKLMPDKRKKAITAFWKFALTAKRSDGTPRATNSTEAIDWTKQFFERARDNDFLMGRRKRSDDHATWQCDLDFLMTEKGRIFVIEKTKEIA